MGDSRLGSAIAVLLEVVENLPLDQLCDLAVDPVFGPLGCAAVEYRQAMGVDPPRLPPDLREKVIAAGRKLGGRDG